MGPVEKKMEWSGVEAKRICWSGIDFQSRLTHPARGAALRFFIFVGGEESPELVKDKHWAPR